MTSRCGDPHEHLLCHDFDTSGCSQVRALAPMTAQCRDHRRRVDRGAADSELTPCARASTDSRAIARCRKSPIRCRPPVPRLPRQAGLGRIRAQKGDFRYRHETIDAEFSSKRHRQRIRARPAISPICLTTSRSASASPPATTIRSPPTRPWVADSPSKSVALDLAYFSWDTPLEGLELDRR